MQVKNIMNLKQIKNEMYKLQKNKDNLRTITMKK